MSRSKRCLAFFMVGIFGALLLPLTIGAQELPKVDSYAPNQSEVHKHKKFFDDPTPYVNTWNDEALLPPEVYALVVSDPEEMKKVWSETVGFKAPDVVGKIHPEIKPGKYTFQEVQANPAFKELMYPDLYNRIKPGGPPHAGNIPEFEIIPTRQYHWALRIAQATQRNEGKTKLKDNGYVDFKTWEGGFPFPKPSGPFKAQQIVYNALVFRRDRHEGNGYLYGHLLGFDKNLKLDMDNMFKAMALMVNGREYLPPYGAIDAKAEENNELYMQTLSMLSPRDISGMTILTTMYMDPDKTDSSVMYVPALRRVRKMSTTDTQDPIAGQDAIVDDQSGFLQKISPTRYPYKMELIEEREYLVVAPTLDGSEYCTSKGLEFRGLKMERRPMYVLKLTQLDPNYVYSKRIVYVDQETFQFYQINNYDQKGRLYRTFWTNYLFRPKAGMFSWGGYLLYRDHVDLHSNVTFNVDVAGVGSRNDLVGQLMKSRK